MQHYGDDLFAMLNDRRLDPLALRALIESPRPVSRAPRMPGYAEGGPVPSFQRNTPTGDDRSRSSAAVITPALVVDGRTAEQFFAASKTQLVRWNRDNRRDVRAALDAQRET